MVLLQTNIFGEAVAACVCLGIPLLILVAFALGLAWSARSSLQRRAVTKAFASRHGLEYSGGLLPIYGMPKVQGRIDGYGINARFFRGNADDTGDKMYMKVELKRKDKFYLAIMRKDVVAELGKAIGIVKVMPVGDPAFDSKFNVATTDEARAKSILDQEMLQKISKFF